MNRRDFLTAASVAVSKRLSIPLSDIAQASEASSQLLWILFDSAHEEGKPFKPGIIAFMASREDTVYALTADLLPVADSSRFGKDFVEGIGGLNLGDGRNTGPGWVYLVNNHPPGVSATAMTVAEGSMIIWQRADR